MIIHGLRPAVHTNTHNNTSYTLLMSKHKHLAFSHRAHAISGLQLERCDKWTTAAAENAALLSPSTLHDVLAYFSLVIFNWEASLGCFESSLCALTGRFLYLKVTPFDPLLNAPQRLNACCYVEHTQLVCCSSKSLN